MTVSIISVGTVLLILMIYLGKIPNLSYYRGAEVRYSFGTQYPLTFAAYIFYLSILLCLKLKDKFLSILIVSLIIISFL